jgi:phenylacetate-CoA ligase
MPLFPASIPAAIEHARTLIRRWQPSALKPEALAAFQRRRLAALVAHCRANVALYREHWRDVDPRATTFDALPAIGKDDFRAREPRASLADGTNADRLITRTTSGSSGQPFAIRRTSVEDHLMQWLRLRAETEFGVRRGDRIVQFGQLPAGGYRRTWPGRLRQALRLHRDEHLDGLADAPALLDALDDRRPDVVRAYPSTLVAIAGEIARRGRRGTSARTVVAGGEVLSPAARRTIGEAFGATIVDCYGMSEFNLLAWECPAGGGFHVRDDNVVVEILGPDGKAVAVGETGEVVATSLHAWAMPFVRYRTGDLAMRGSGSCPCGAPWSTLSAIQGRAAECLLLPGGRSVHPYRITGAIADDDADWIAQHQLVQHGEDRVVLSIATRRSPRPGELERLRSIGAREVGPGTTFEVNVVDGFALAPGAKFAPYVSSVARDAPSRSGAAT